MIATALVVWIAVALLPNGEFHSAFVTARQEECAIGVQQARVVLAQHPEMGALTILDCKAFEVGR